MLLPEPHVFLRDTHIKELGPALLVVRVHVQLFVLADVGPQRDCAVRDERAQLVQLRVAQEGAELVRQRFVGDVGEKSDVVLEA